MSDLTDRLDHLMAALDLDGRADDAALVHEAIDELRGSAATPQAPERWAIVSLFGHAERAGRVNEETVAGAAMLRVDIPLEDGSFSTRHVGGAALYEITYVTEEVARAVAKARPGHPLGTWSVRSLGLLPPAPAPERLMVDERAFLGDEEEDDDEEAVRDDAIPPLDDARVEDGDVPGHGTVEEAMSAAIASGLPF